MSRSGLILAAILVSSLNAAPTPPYFTVTDISSYTGGKESAAYALNDSGTVVGQIEAPRSGPPAQFLSEQPKSGGKWLPFIFQNGQVRILGDSDGIIVGAARLINNAGIVVGYYADTELSNAPWFGGFVYQADGSLTKPSALGSGMPNIGSPPQIHELWDINNSGVIVGRESGRYAVSYYYTPGASDATYFGSTTYTAGSIAYAINDHGVIVGSGPSGDYRYENGVMTDLPKLSSTRGCDINNLGDIVGQSHNKPSLYQNAVVEDLGELAGVTIQGSATKINDSGEILGYGFQLDVQKPFLYVGGKIYALQDLIDPAFTLTITDVSGINASGAISATATTSEGLKHAILLTPNPWPSDREVPTPPAWPTPTPTPTPSPTPVSSPTPTPTSTPIPTPTSTPSPPPTQSPTPSPFPTAPAPPFPVDSVPSRGGRPPTVTIFGPKLLTTSRDHITIQGRSTGHPKYVSGTMGRRNHHGQYRVSGITHWHARFPLQKGINYLNVRAGGGAQGPSRTATVIVIRQ